MGVGNTLGFGNSTGFGNSPGFGNTGVHGRAGVKFQNWSQTYGCSPELYFQPSSVEELREGSIPAPIPVPIPSLGAVSEVSAAGVIGTGTHNTGIKHGILPTQVVALTLLLASGEILECSEAANPEVFQAARLHLGCLGIVLSVTFQCVPEFRLREVAFPATLPQVLEQLEEHLERSQYFRFLWFPHSDHVRIIYQDPTDRPPCSSSSWIWDYAVGYYLLEFLLWIRPYGKAVPTREYWSTYERIMRKHGGRPHWAK
ncbi:L-gulonolactone oxidase-like, partial [Manacus vitellinus]|uniref:L-gulonolactone oxidase-like n=1 Tax=Manacus vitellinus TaxID=328815 RepID=UPI00115CADE8